MTDEPLRADDSYVPPACYDNVFIQDAHIRTGGDNPMEYYELRYVIQSDGRVLAQRPFGPPIVITPVGYGVHINHIELTVPGGGKARYGYLCK